jgi:predicted XRE-type DNA-binding protein
MSATVHPLPSMKRRDMDAQQSRAITAQIQSSVSDLAALVVQAFHGRVWLALGYPSWADYIKDEFRDSPLHLHRDDRRAVVELLRGHGMSQRAIADAVGVGVGTVNHDLTAGVQNRTPAPERGVESVKLRERRAWWERQTSQGDTEPTPITGLDGKTYRPKPPQPQANPKPRRKPITDEFNSAVNDLDRLVMRLKRTTTDDRFSRHREQLAGRRLALIHQRDRLNEVIDQLVDTDNNL